MAALLLLTGGMIPASAAPNQPASAIPIHILNTNAGRVMTAHIEEYDNKFHVGGLVDRPSSIGMGAHVHVWGVDQAHHRVFSQTTSVSISGKPSFIHSESYTVSVNPAAFEKAKVIYVTFHGQTDAEFAKAK